LGIVVKDGIIIESYEHFGLYIVATILASTVGTSVYCFVRYFSTGLEEMLLEPVFGFSPVLLALAMYVRAYKRDTPIKDGALETATSPHGALLAKITYNNLPVVLVLAHIACYCISPLKVFSQDLPFSFVSLFFSWSYCRFYYRFQAGSGLGAGAGTGTGGRSTGTGGDAEGEGEGEAGAGGDSFAFVAMFPSALHVVIVPLSTAFYNLFALIGVFPPLAAEERRGPRHHLDRGAGSGAGAGAGGGLAHAHASPLVKESRPDAVQERRRAKALKLLESKMAQLNATDEEDSGWGDDDAADRDRVAV
jgi:hypothetical protein